MAGIYTTPVASVTVIVPSHEDWRIGKPHVEAALRRSREQGAVIDEHGRVRARYLRGTWVEEEEAK